MRKLPAILIFSVFLMPASGMAEQPSALSSLSDAEQSYYFKVFDYAMAALQPGGKYDWASYSGKGSISADKPFLSKSGATCRKFTESYTVLGQQGADKGVGCKREGKDGWCRLKPDNALTCAMENPALIFALPMVNTPNYSGAGSTNTNVNTDVHGPNVRTNVNVNTPDAPNVKTDGVTAKGVATNVTGTMGRAAGSAVSNGISLFTEFFR